MTYFPQNPISQPNRFGAPPRNPREAADAIMAYLDREAAGAAMPRAPFAPFLAETYEPPSLPETNNEIMPIDASYALGPLGNEEEEGQVELPLPFPDAQTDDERIENVLWLLEKNPFEATAPNDPSHETITFDLEQLADWADWTEVADTGHKLRPGKFGILRAIADLAVAQGIGAKLIQQVYNIRVKRLASLEPNNSLLKSKSKSTANPNLRDLDELRDEIAAAERRYATRGPVPKQPPGESEGAATGRGAHGFHKVHTIARRGKGNVTIGQSGRADALYKTHRGKRSRVDELKRRDQLKQAELEAETYAKEHRRLEKQPTDWRGVTYDEKELWERVRRDLKK